MVVGTSVTIQLDIKVSILIPRGVALADTRADTEDNTHIKCDVPCASLKHTNSPSKTHKIQQTNVEYFFQVFIIINTE